MTDLFLQGGPVMWPLLLCSLITVAIIVERACFLCAEYWARDESALISILRAVEQGNRMDACAAGKTSRDFAVRALSMALRGPDSTFQPAMLEAANTELACYGRGLGTLDTIVTLAPLLGLLGTVTGMIRAFGLLGAHDLGTPTAITGGIAEALLATAFGLGIAITALVPGNYLGDAQEKARRRLEKVATQAEIKLIELRPGG